MMESDRLWEELRHEQDRICAGKGYLAQAKSRRSRARRAKKAPLRWQWFAATGALAAAPLGVLLLMPRSQRALAFSTGPDASPGKVGDWVAASGQSVLPLTFSDGTLFRLSAGSRARVSSVDANGARVVLERGAASASVVHRSSSHWLVDVGPFELTVVGTRFDVSWDANEEVFKVDLREGAVTVSGACLREPKRVTERGRLRVSCKGGHDEVIETHGDRGLGDGVESRSTPVVDAAEATAQPALSADRAPPHAVADTAPPIVGARPASLPGSALRSEAWRTLMLTGRFREALSLVEQHGFEEECRRASAVDLLELGDAARFAGNANRARQAYVAARKKLPDGGRTGYSLGVTAFDLDRQFPAAAAWFEAYLAEQPYGELRREAAGRLMDAWQRAGDLAKASAAAERYLRDYPDGIQAPLARQLLSH